MPKVDPNTHEPISDAPDQADEDAAGGEGFGGDTGQLVDSDVSTGPDNPRESQAGSMSTPEGKGPSETGGGM
ncbi:MAG TPA: hypothetical protein VHF24_03650 [Acidimicrobiales bacterium]|jgi:hypothetical protein|nr:hypothetical protein [Acidimicrobiales bacterium]